MIVLYKYPRTNHLEGSRLQPGDEDLSAIPFAELAGRPLVVEEKLDGANAGISFDGEGRMWLQSRGHFLTGGPREKHFAPFKQWAAERAGQLGERLGDRYVLYGEWLYAKHTVFYDQLPAWFLEFDVLDLAADLFLSTERRRALLEGLGIASVPVLREGPARRLDELTSLVGPSLYKSARWRERLAEAAAARGLDVERMARETNPSDEMEGLYLKWEEDGRVMGRYKWIRAGFLTSVVDSGSHWLSRPILPNEVAPLIPQPPDWRIDFAALQQYLEPLRGCPQDPIHHAEGDVELHTRLVLESLAQSPRFRALDEASRRIVFWASLLHDVAKPECTRTESDGRISARGHSPRGAILARRILWRTGMEFAAREQVCNLIRHHQVPFFLIEKPDGRRSALEISLSARCDLLALVAEADARGRTCADQQRLLDHIELFRALCEEERCLDQPYAFPSAHARFHYLQRGGRDSQYRPHEEFRSEVLLLSGLPGAGKDHLASAEFSDWPTVSLDRVRAELDIDPAEHQAGVLAEARDQARVQLRLGGRLLWNATNLSRQLRGPLISLFADYGARVRIVYVEASEQELHAQNRARAQPVPTQVIERLYDKWEVPTLAEAHDVEWRVR